MDKTLTDKQKEHAGAVAAFGETNRSKCMPITMFALKKTSASFEKSLNVLVCTTRNAFVLL